MYIIYGINLRRYLKREAINLEVLLDYISQMGMTEDFEDALDMTQHEIINNINDAWDNIIEFLQNYDGFYGTGISAFMQDFIYLKEQVSLSAEYDQNADALGIVYNLPWNMCESVKNLSEMQFAGIITKYVGALFNFPIKFENIEIEDFDE